LGNGASALHSVKEQSVIINEVVELGDDGGKLRTIAPPSIPLVAVHMQWMNV
jgi:hypothetical protein